MTTPASLPRRFLFAIPSVSSPVGEQFADLAVFLRDQGHQAVIATQSDVKESPVGTRLDGKVDVHLWPADAASTLQGARFISGLTKAWRPDCIVSQFLLVSLSTLAAWVHHVPRRVAWHRTLTEQSAVDRGGRPLGWRLRVQRRRQLYRLATDLVSVSRAGVDDLELVYGVPAGKCSIIPNGIIDLGLRRPLDPNRGERIVLAVGRLVPSKNHGLLIDAFERVRANMGETKLVIIGDGPLMTDLQNRCRAIGIADSVHFTGKLPHREAMKYLSGADVLAHPSVIDNCPGVIQEAMSLGVPIVATPVGGIPELVESEQTALFASASDGADFGRQLCRVLTDRDLTQRITRAARRRFEQCYERQTFIERTADFLLAGSRHSPLRSHIGPVPRRGSTSNAADHD